MNGITGKEEEVVETSSTGVFQLNNKNNLIRISLT